MTTVDKPSFARYLRTYGKLGPPAPNINIEELFERRRQWKKACNKVASWQEVKNNYSRNYKCSTEAINKMLVPLRTVAREAVGSEANDALVDEAAVSLLHILLGEKTMNCTLQTKLITTFGTLPPAWTKKALEVVDGLACSLNENQVASLKAACSAEKEDTSNRWEFGQDIEVSPPVPWEPPDTSFLEPLLPVHKTSSVVDTFTMDYDSYAAGTSSADQDKPKYGRYWLEGLVTKYYPVKPKGFENVEMSDYLSSILQSAHSNDELQGELLDMLGYDKVELLQELIEHRNEFTSSLSQPEPEMPQERERVKPWKLTPLPRKPQLGCQVTVQSEKEVLAAKQLRRAEKRLQKSQQSQQDSDSEEEFNPAYLRTKRLEELQKARQKPLFGPRKVVLPRREYKESYPHVYDMQRDAKHAAAFVGSKKMMLPEGVERNNTRVYEEVNIPLPPISELPVGDELVPVSSLDETCRLAFSGMETLNRIQSIVYETAYNTNENLLICAPTGAGKTNVALLTMMRTIKSNIVNGVINKNKFKIVYIAPMKALAAEMAKSFTKRLGPLSIVVRELTGDMQLTKREIQETQVLVTTPEKWDVVTRKGGQGGDQLTTLVQLVIIDEVHLLHGDRGPVVETLVARTLRLVETSQSMIRIVGLSATLPNYLDVALFLRVNPYKGLFFFDSRFRPVPLSMSFVGVKTMKMMQQQQDMDDICYDKVLEMVRKGHQVMVFVHTRNGTTRTARVLHDKAQMKNELELFAPKQTVHFSSANKAISSSRNRPLAELFPAGFSIHHAGMLRSDRNMVEKYFGEGLINVLVCTSTLAWGVNLPAHAVIIKGTEIYDSKHGTFVDLGILDVLQIFGRAGRPQFDRSGHGCIITSHDKLSHYLSLLTDQYPIESNFVYCLADNLNAEVVLGTITNLDEAVEWLSYTYFHVRMRKNPLMYGINHEALLDDTLLAAFRKDLIISAAKKLSAARMLRFDMRTGDLNPTDIGRTASYFYIKYDTMEIFNEKLQSPDPEKSVVLNEADIIALISQAEEFNQLKVRDDEQDELDQLVTNYCEVHVKDAVENLNGKVNVLIQTYLSQGRVNSFSLSSDMSFISQNAVRIARGLFDMVLRQNDALLAGRMLNMAKMLQLRLWDFHHPLRQFPTLSPEILTKIESRRLSINVLREMPVSEIGAMIRHERKGADVKRCAEEFPSVEVESSLQPITRTILRIRLTIHPTFKWNDRVHGKISENFWVWIEDPDTNRMYHHEYLLLTKKQVITREPQELVATIPLMEPMPSQYLVRIINDRWLGSEDCHALTFQHLILPDDYPPHTDLLPLQPLPITALQDTRLQSLYTSFSHFNPIQTQVFHCLYHSDENVVLGAPTGSGKTLVAELAMFRVFREQPGAKVVYIAPMKALVRERVQDWGERLGRRLGRKIVELTGDATPDARAIAEADVVVTTPEKWDGVSRSWQTRGYVRQVGLLVIDEIHLLGEERGPVLEVIVSRANFIAAHAGHQVRKCRVVGLSTALANAGDLAQWLKITSRRGMYNFRPSVRPVPLSIHIQGFPGKHYCPRMATMNKPTFQAVRQHSPNRPALVFVSSRRQTRLTGMDLISYLAAEDNPKQWLHMPEIEAENIAATVTDPNLRLLLPFGIGIHHAGLKDHDRSLVEELFVSEKIQVLIATATLAWGVNFPAHLVVVKGTEYFDGKQHRYVDMPITDVLQMMGRAGRPQFDESAVAVVLVHDAKKNFYKKFLHEPFPVESSLLGVLPDHINAEIVAGVIQTRQEALEYLTWTYFFRRLLKNPSYYKLASLEASDVNGFLSSLVESTVVTLQNSNCITELEDGRSLEATCLGRIASYYYLSHKTLALFEQKLDDNTSLEMLMRLLSDTTEYAELPVRHNEDGINLEMSKLCRYKTDPLTMDSPHSKAFLLFQAHISRLELPSSDYYTDLKSVLDQAIRIIQAMVDVCAEYALLATTLRALLLLQSIVQAAWPDQSSLCTLPHVEPPLAQKLSNRVASTLPKLQEIAVKSPQEITNVLSSQLNKKECQQVLTMLRDLPCPAFNLSIRGWWDGGTEAEERMVPQRDTVNPYMQLHADQDYVLYVKPMGGGRCGNAHASRFPRPKDVGWFLILGLDCESVLLALKRAPANNRPITVGFTTPSTLGKAVLTLYIISNCYLGIDQQYDLYIQVIEPSIEAQMNTEVTR